MLAPAAERHVSGVLNSFHRLYDVLRKRPTKDTIDWYKTASLASVLLLRNGRHHNHGNGIRTLYSYHADTAPDVTTPKKYVLIDFPAREEGADTFEVFLAWADIDSILRLPKKEIRTGPETINAVRTYLGSDRYSAYAEKFGLNDGQVFLNVVPLIVNAAGTIVPQIKNFIRPNSTEARLFVDHFEDVQPADTERHEIALVEFALPR